IQGALPSAPGANKIDPSKLLADNEDNSSTRMEDVQNASGGGGNSDDQFRGGVLLASKDADVPSGNARSGVGTNFHGVNGGEGNGGGGQGGDADRFGSGLGGSFGYSMNWLQGGTRRKLSGALPKYPRGVNVEAQISILAVVSPDGSIKSVQPAQKANTQLENAAMKELRYWKFEPLRASTPQVDQSCLVTFVFKLK
ncbi:MAG TPA: energy transducer TonB, partial [Bacteroidota bacterium]